MKKELDFETGKQDSDKEELKKMSIEQLREQLAEYDMKLKALADQKKTFNKGLSSLIKEVKTKAATILDVLEAKDSETSRRVLKEVTRA